jgi:hypothetical protein
LACRTADEELYREYQARLAGKILTDIEIAASRTECRRVADYIDQLEAISGTGVLNHTMDRTYANYGFVISVDSFSPCGAKKNLQKKK